RYTEQSAGSYRPTRRQARQGRAIYPVCRSSLTTARSSANCPRRSTGRSAATPKCRGGIRSVYNNYACTINGKHTYYHYGLYVTNTAPIAPPEVRTQYIEVPGRNGNLDLTDVLTGRPVYGDRKITLEMGGKKPAGEWPGFFSRFLADVHGKKVEIVFDNDPGCYYVGRAIVSGAYERGNE